MSHQGRVLFLFVLATAVMVGISGAVWADLDTWEKRHPVDALNAVTYGGGLYVAVGNSGRIRTSSDGIAWTTRTSPVSSHLTGIVYGNGMYAAVGGGGRILTSPDAVTWTAGNSGTDKNLLGIAFGGGQYKSCIIR